MSEPTTEATEEPCVSCKAVPGTPEYDNWHDSQNCWRRSVTDE